LFEEETETEEQNQSRSQKKRASTKKTAPSLRNDHSRKIDGYPRENGG
jgi:hypothetical protein